MNFQKIHREALEVGIEKTEPTDPVKAAEDHVQALHNDWLRHQDTRELIAKIHLQKSMLLSKAVIHASKNAGDSEFTSSLLNQVAGLDQVLTIINSYGERRDN